MATKALYLKWRPQRFDDVIGQQHITRTLQGAIYQERIRHAYLFSGPRGTGKTTTARLLAKAVNCLHTDIAARPCNACAHCQAISTGRFLDIIEIDAASHTGVDDVRDLRDKISFAPSEGRYKVYIIDEVHRFSGAAFDALLKTLEEPPRHALFILATTEIHKVPDTIKSRCLIFEFRRVSLREVVDRLRLIVDSEGFSVDDAALELIARQGTGSVRDSISLLDQIVSDPTEHISFALAQAMLGAAGTRYVWEVAQAIAEMDPAYGLDQINEAIDTGADPRQFGRQLVEHLRKLLLIQMGSGHMVDASDEIRNLMMEQTEYFSRTILLKAIRAFNAAIDDMRGGWQPQLPLEIALIETILPPGDEPPPPPRPAPERRRPIPAPPVEDAPTNPHSSQVPSSQSASLGEADLPPSRAEETLDSASADEAPGLDINQVLDYWPRFLEMVRAEHKSLASILKKTQPLGTDGLTVVIGIDNETHHLKLDNAKTRTQIVPLLQKLFGEGVDVRIELVQDSASATGGATDRVSGDPLLSYAKSLGAEITFNDLDEES
ncbi:MAG: DNA polymerase III subunit gamma/tau [Chloroflexi bacterium]|nr:DNA polymerase III subunit gamma/tau [Chloroflexota bacterium]